MTLSHQELERFVFIHEKIGLSGMENSQSKYEDRSSKIIIFFYALGVILTSLKLFELISLSWIVVSLVGAFPFYVGIVYLIYKGAVYTQFLGAGILSIIFQFKHENS